MAAVASSGAARRRRSTTRSHASSMGSGEEHVADMLGYISVSGWGASCKMMSGHEEKNCSKKLVDELIEKLDRALEILGRIASEAPRGRVVAQPKPRDHREALLYEMMREESSLRWAYDNDSEQNTSGMQEVIKQRVLRLWFASKLWRYGVKSSIDMYTKLFEACKAYDGHLEIHTPSGEESAQFNKGGITRELTAWARSHCYECFGDTPDTPAMIRKFHENMKATPTA